MNVGERLQVQKFEKQRQKAMRKRETQAWVAVVLAFIGFIIGVVI